MTILKILSHFVLLLFLALGLATLRMANAESLPEGSLANNETYAVTGVDGDDVLNIRAQPEASAAIVGTIPANGVGIQLLGPAEQQGRSTWRRIDYQETRGWVNARFLAAQATTGDAPGFETNLQCLGTEPFWSIRIQNSQMELDQMGDQSAFSVSPPTASANHTNIWALTFENKANGKRGVAFLERTEQCSDDMSNHRYRYTLRVRLGKDEVLSGCCNRIR